MKNIVLAAVLAVFAFAFAGCDDYATPTGVVRTAAEKAQQHKLKGFKKALGGNALAQYGSKEGMEQLNSLDISAKGFRVSDATLLASKPVTNNGFQTEIRTYAVQVLDYDLVRLTATVNCDIFVIESSDPACGPMRTGACMPSMNNGTEVSECKIVELH